MDIAVLILDYLRVLVWPVVAGALLFWLRAPIKRKVADVLKVRLPGMEAEFTAAASRLEHDIAEPAGVLTAGIDVPRPGDQPDDESRSASPLDVTRSGVTQRPEETRRGAIADIIRDAVLVGFDLGRKGVQEAPVPTVEWDDNGRPLVTIEHADVSYTSKELYGDAVRRALVRVSSNLGGSLEVFDGEALDFAIELANRRRTIVKVRFHTGMTFHVGTILSAIDAADSSQESGGFLFISNTSLLPSAVRRAIRTKRGYENVQVETLVWRDRKDDHLLTRALLRVSR